MGSNISNCDGPPVMNRLDHVLGFAGHALVRHSGRVSRRCELRWRVVPPVPTAPMPPQRRLNHTHAAIVGHCIMAKKSPHSLTTEFGHTARACRWQDRLSARSSSLPVGSRDRILRYRSRILPRRPGSAGINFWREPRPSSCMNGLFMTNSCCNEVVVRSRSGAGLRRIGKIVDAQQIAEPAAADPAIHGATHVLFRYPHSRMGRTSSRPAFPRRAEAYRDRPRYPSGADSCARGALFDRIDLRRLGTRTARLPVCGRKHDFAIAAISATSRAR